MGHHAQNVAAGADDPGDVTRGAVRIRIFADVPILGGVAEDDATVGLQVVQRLRIGEIVALAVGDGDAQDLACLALAGERRL